MRAFRNLFTKLVLLSVFTFLLPATVYAWPWGNGATCDDIEERGHINILTFNILFFSEELSPQERLVPIANFVETKYEKGYPIDVIFIQEAVGGTLALNEFTNTAKLLKEMLADRRLDYNLKTAFEVGVPGVFYTGNATLSRCEIKYSIVKRLPKASEIEILGQVIELPRNAQWTRINVPNFGDIDTCTTHLCANCTVVERGDQLEVLFDFLDNVDNIFPGENPIILAGDFNIDIFRENNGVTFGPEKDLYDMIVEDEGFIDAYAEYFYFKDSLKLTNLCRDINPSDVHCTVGVTAFDSFSEKGRRIDYVFQQGFVKSKFARVFFNPVVGGVPADLASDHAAVFVSLYLP
jgi:maltose 6'-phosphate phosphatase